MKYRYMVVLVLRALHTMDRHNVKKALFTMPEEQYKLNVSSAEGRSLGN
jgi:hypothetical protein